MNCHKSESNLPCDEDITDIKDCGLVHFFSLSLSVMQGNTEAANGGILKESCFSKICNNHRKTLVSF